MRRRGLWLAAAVLAAAIIGYYGIVVYPQQRFQRALDEAMRRLPAGTTATYREAHYALPSGQARITGIDWHGTLAGPESGEFALAIDEIEVIGPSLDLSAAWARAAADPAALAPEQVLPVADAIILHGMSFKGPQGSASLESLRIDKPRLYPWALLQPGIASWSEVQATLLQPPPQPGLQMLLPLLRLEAAVMLGLGYDRYAAENLKAIAHIPATPNAPAMAVAYAVRRMACAFDRGVLKDAAAEELAMQMGPLGSFGIDRIIMTDMDVRKPALAVLSGAPLAPDMLDGLSLGRLEYAGMHFQLASGPPAALGSFAFSNVAFEGALPVSGALGWSGLHLTRAQMQASPQALALWDRFGLDEVTLSMTVAYDWDPPLHRLRIHDTALRAEELGVLTLSAELSELAPGAAALAQGRMDHALLRYEDRSLAERALRAGAAWAGAEPGALRTQLAAAVQQQGAALGPTPQIEAATKAIAGFVAAPHVLAIELAPDKPVPLAALAGAKAMPPPALFAMLGLRVTSGP